MPESDVGEPCFRVRDHLQINRFVRVDTGHPEFHAAQRYLSVGVGGSGVSKAEDIMCRFIRERKLERTKQALPFTECFFETNDRDLSGCTVHLNFVVPFDLIAQYFPYLCDAPHVLPCAGPDNAILKPSVRSLDFSFCLGGKSIYHFDAKVLQYLFPLGVCFICLYIVFSPYRIPLLYETEY